MPNYTQYRDSTDTTRTPSPNIWADCPTLEMLHNPAAGYHFFDDFIAYNTLAVAGDDGKYELVADTGAVMAQLADTDHGVVTTSGMDAANDGLVFAHGYEAGFARLNTTDKMWFECRIKRVNVTDDILGYFVGLTIASTLTGDTGLVDTTTALADNNYVGFWQADADGDVVEPVYKEASGTAAQVGSGVAAALGSGNDITIAADTYIKLGMKFTGTGGGSGGQGRIEYFANGARVAWIDSISSATYAWPDGDHHCMSLIVKNVGGTGTDIVSLDWWRVAAVAE